MKLAPPFVFALALACMTPYACAATLPVAEDTSSLKGKLTLANHKATNLKVDGTRHAFVFFNLTELPSSAQIRYARLRLFFPTVTRSGSGLTLHKTSGQWNEGVAGNEPAYDATPLATFTPESVGAKRFVSVDVTDTVKAWRALPESNEGFAIAAVPGATTKQTASVALGSKEGTGTGYPAELEVELAAVDGAITSEQLAPNLTLGGTTSGTFSGSGAALTALSTANLTGQLAATQLQPNLSLAGTTSGTFSGDGAALSALNASNLASGTVPDGRLVGTYNQALTLTNASNAISGAFTATADANQQGFLLKNPAMGMILHSPSFGSAIRTGNGSYDPQDGSVLLQASANQFSSIQLQSQYQGVTLPLDRAGVYLSARVGCQGVPVAGHYFYIVVGSITGADPTGFGFKAVGDKLHGVTSEGAETLTDLGLNISNGTFYSLLAIRRANSIEFYVDGLLKGTSTTNLPAQSDSGYVLKAVNNSTATTLRLKVAYLSIGIPMF